MDDVDPAEIRQLQRRLSDLEARAEGTRRATVGLVVALVGLLVGLSLPWFMAEPDPLVPDGFSGVDGGVTAWVDGWLVTTFGGDYGWVAVVMALTPLALAALVAVLLPGLEAALARVVVVLGSLTAAGLLLMWLLSFGSGGIQPGSGMLVTACAAVVAAVSANSVRRLPQSKPLGATAASLLPPISIAAMPLPPSSPSTPNNPAT